MSVNRVLLIARVGKDPEVKQVNDTTVAKFSLATSESFKNKSGEKVEQTEWHSIIIWGKLCDVVSKYVKKGDMLYVEGKITYREYDDKDGNKRNITEIKVSEFKMLGSKKDKAEPAGDFTDSEKVSENMGRTTAPDDEPLPF
jgi:single-strand DNA-binding protein